jgi:hypothetical protein
MSDDQSFERATREFMEDGSDRTSAATIDAVLLAVRTTPQERGLRIPWRTVPMSNPMRLVAAIAVIVIVGVAAANLLGGSPGIGGVGSSPSPAVTPSAPPPAPSAQPSPSAGAATWPIYTSNRYGFSIGHPSNWTVRPAASTWALPVGKGSAGAGGAEDPMGTATEGSIAPAQSVLVSAWSVAVVPGTSAAAWIQTYCPKETAPCTGIPARTVAVSMDGHAGSLVRFTDDVEAFVLVNNRMYIVAEWRADNDQANLAGYASGTLLVKDFLSTMHLLPGGPGASASPRPS